MLFFIYDVVLLSGFILYLPLYFWRGKITWAALREKFGFIPFLKGRKPIWIQVVSVGVSES